MFEIVAVMKSAIGAVIFGAVGIFALGCLVVAQSHLRKRMMAMIFPLIIFGIAAGAFLVQRDFTKEIEETFGAASDSALIIWFFRMMTAGLLGICLVRLISVSQSMGRRPREGRSLFFAFVFFYFTNVVLNNIFGTSPIFPSRFIPPVIIFIAMYYSRHQNPGTVIDATKVGLFLLVIGSCLLALVRPEIALQTGYDMSYIPGMTVRLWGLGSNPNSLGPLAIIFLLLIMYRPFRSRWLQRVSIAAGLAVLVLTQSKTAWVAGTVAFSIVWWTRNVSSPTSRRNRAYSYYSFRDLVGPILLNVAGLAWIALMALLIAYDREFALLDQKLQISSLTGRTDIWSAAIEAWKTNPLFGYGSSAWGPEFRKMIGIDAAVSAHSQYFQSLSEAGAIGLIGLLVYMGTLFRRSYAANRETRGLTLALFSMIFIRSISETPLDITNSFNGDFLVHLLLFRLALVRTHAPAALPYPQSQPQFQWSKA